MADIKFCPRCCGRPYINHSKRGYIWRHKCKSYDEELTFESRRFESFGECVRDWNTRAKRLKELQMMVHHHLGEVMK